MESFLYCLGSNSKLCLSSLMCNFYDKVFGNLYLGIFRQYRQHPYEKFRSVSCVPFDWYYDQMQRVDKNLPTKLLYALSILSASLNINQITC